MSVDQVLQGGCCAAILVGHAGQLQSHLHAAKRSGEHEVVEAAEMSNAKYLSGEPGETCTERHVEGIENDLAKIVGVVSSRHEDCCQGA